MRKIPAMNEQTRVLLIPDGAADVYRFCGRSPLDLARTPNLDWMAEGGVTGLMQTLYPNLPKDSVVNISQLITIDKSDLTEKIGSLTSEQMRKVIEGITLLIEPREIQ